MDIILKNKEDIAGTQWIEFNVSDKADGWHHWADNSKYLDEYSYNFFTDIFEKVSINFNYYGETTFKNEQLIDLRQSIENRITTLDEFDTIQDIIELSKRTSFAFDLTEEIEGLSEKQGFNLKNFINEIKSLGRDLVLLVDKCIEKKETLVVLGL
jgi:hypothetical protein